MTLIITVVTDDYILLASDMRLTWGTGPKIGQSLSENTCKLVNYNNIGIFGYSGHAFIERKETHEWLGEKLATVKSGKISDLTNYLAGECTKAFKNDRSNVGHAFVMSLWGNEKGSSSFKPYTRIITNSLDEHLCWTKPRKHFYVHDYERIESAVFCSLHIGARLNKDRETKLYRFAEKLANKSLEPKNMLRLLSDEIIYKSLLDNTVGNKVLAACIPRSSVENKSSNKPSVFAACQPTIEQPTFTYLDDGYDEIIQYAPTLVFENVLTTNLVTTKDVKNGSDSSSVSVRVIL